MTAINTEYLTDTQVMRKVIAATKQWIKERKYNDVQVQYIRGTYHVTNHLGYMLTAKDVLELSTGLQFVAISDSMSKLN